MKYSTWGKGLNLVTKSCSTFECNKQKTLIQLASCAREKLRTLVQTCTRAFFFGCIKTRSHYRSKSVLQNPCIPRHCKKWNIDRNLPCKDDKAFLKVGILIGIYLAKTVRHFKKWTVCSKGHFVSRNAPPLFPFVSHDTWQISSVYTRYHKRKWFFFFVFFADTLCTVMPFGVG